MHTRRHWGLWPFLLLALVTTFFPGAKARPVTAGAVAPIHWVPAQRSTFQWQLSGAIDTSYQAMVYDIDLFDASPAIVHRLHAAHRHVMCYLSAGSYEDWRPDARIFLRHRTVLGKAYPGWPGERWIDIRNIAVLGPIMRPLRSLAKERGSMASRQITSTAIRRRGVRVSRSPQRSRSATTAGSRRRHTHGACPSG